MSGRGERDGLGVVLLGVGLIVVVALFAIDAGSNPELHRRYGRDPGPGFQPYVMLWLLGGGAVVLIGQGLYLIARAGWRVQSPLAGIDRLLLPVIMVLSMLAFIWAAPIVGFLPSAIAFTAAWAAILALQDEGLGRPVRLGLLILGAAAVAGVMFFLFRRLIGVPFP
jgi:hypothetical protein